MRIMVEVDQEGCAGILDWYRDITKSGRDAWASRIMTDEFNAVVEGALSAGADEVFGMESHAFDYERIHPKATVISANMLEHDCRCDALFFVGRHAMYGVQDGVLNHTGSAYSMTGVRFNGRPFGELGMVAAWFGRLGVPSAFVAGDAAACREARAFLGKVVTVPVKKGYACHEAESLTHEEACRRIQRGAADAVKRLPEFRPFVVKGKVRLEVDYRHSEIVDWICRIPNLKRVSATQTRFDAKDFADALRMYYAQGAMLYRYDA